MKRIPFLNLLMATRHRNPKQPDAEKSGFTFSLNMRCHFAVHSVHMVAIVRLYGETT